MNLKNLLWLFPFLTFAIGYIFASLFLNNPTLQAPDIIGKSMYDAIKLCSNHQLHLYILEEKIDEHMPSGTIISQRPHQGTQIKSNQALYVVATKNPPCPKTPLCIGMNQKEVQALCNTNGIKARVHFVQSNLPVESCIAQWPSQNCDLPAKKMIIYCSQPEQKLYVFPNFLHENALKAHEFLSSYEITPSYYYQNKLCVCTPQELDSYTIVQQRPLSGTFIDLQKKISIRFEVEISSQNSSGNSDNQ
jgi:beta-lactam-binding protein with PASTA domain